MPELALESLDFLLNSSKRTLQDFELNRLGMAAELRKQIRIMQDAMNKADAEARFARWLMENWDDMLEYGRTGTLQTTMNFPRRIAAD